MCLPLGLTLLFRFCSFCLVGKLWTLNGPLCASYTGPMYGFLLLGHYCKWISEITFKCLRKEIVINKQ